jgi:hypothetical protein
MAHTVKTEIDCFYFVPARGKKLGEPLLDRAMNWGAQLYLIPESWWLRPGWC